MPLSRDWIPVERGQLCSCTKAEGSDNRGISVLFSGSWLDPFCLELKGALLSSPTLKQELCLRNTSLQTNGSHVHHLPDL